MKLADQNRLIVLITSELQAEYLQILKSRKLKLPEARVELFDSTSKWGDYDSFLNVIRLSKNLVFKFSWAQVLNVLKHEIAHQIVAFECKSKLSQIDPHGEEFQHACSRLALPKAFRSSRLEEVSLNQNLSEPSELATEKLTRSDIVEKAKKLLALAQSSNEHEAQLAAKKVQELFLKYNLEQASLDNTQYCHLILSLNKTRLSVFEKKLISVLCEFYFVQIVVVQEFNIQLQKRTWALEFLGLAENIKMAEYVYYFLLEKCQSLACSIETFHKESFKLGLLEGFSEKLRSENSFTTGSSKAFADQAQTKSSVSETQNSVSVVEKKLLFQAQAELQSYVENYFPHLRRLKNSARKLTRDGFNSGIEHGKKITVNKPLTDKRNSTKKLTYR